MRITFLCLAALIIGLWGPFALDGRCEQDVEVVVAKGDNLISICETYLDDPKDWPHVARANRMEDPNWIYPGQRIVIPAKYLKGIPISGVAVFVKGTVEIRPKGALQWRILRRNDLIPEGSRLRTGSDGALEVSFEDGSAFFMKPDTTVGLRKARVRGMVYIIRELILEAGRVITRIRKSTGQESRFEVITPAATAGARGTDFRTGSDRDSVTRIEVLSGTVDARAGRKSVVLNRGEGTFVTLGRPPAPPIALLDPPGLLEPQAMYRRLPLEFRFDGVAGASAYRVSLAADDAFRDIIAETVIPPSGAARIDDVADGRYLMRVQSIDGAGLEGLSSPAFPVAVRVNPVPPFVSAPVQGREYRATAVTCSWLRVTDAERYDAELASDPGFTAIVRRQDGIAGTSWEVTDLSPSTYYLRIRSVASDGFAGDWSDGLRFVMSPPPPAPPTEPPELGEKQITIRWQDQGPGMRYHFQMAKDEAFSGILADEILGASEITLDTPESFGTYYIRVSGIDADGFEGRFSTPQAFDVKMDPEVIRSILLAIGTILVILVP